MILTQTISSDKKKVITSVAQPDMYLGDIAEIEYALSNFFIQNSLEFSFSSALARDSIRQAVQTAASYIKEHKDTEATFVLDLRHYTLTHIEKAPIKELFRMIAYCISGIEYEDPAYLILEASAAGGNVLLRTANASDAILRFRGAVLHRATGLSAD